MTDCRLANTPREHAYEAHPRADGGRTVLILVTGAASGIGRATVLGLAVADLSSQGQVRRLASEVLERLRRIHVLVNNVGGYWSTRHVTVDGLERTLRSYDRAVAARLWEASSDLVSLTAAPRV